jgi:hypothetical protein
MEQDDSTSGVTPYELATLASRICPERCFSEPKEAIAAAERLLQEAKMAPERAERAYWAEIAKEDALSDEQAPRVQWVAAVKKITGQKRRDRAEARFLEFWAQEEPATYKKYLNEFKRDGLTPNTLDAWVGLFMDRSKQPKRKKGKQGRRISDHDGRLRTQLVGLVPKKPSERS